MLAPSLSDPPTSAKAGGASASRLGQASRVKAGLRAAVAMGIIGVTTGCQSQGQIPGQRASLPPSQSVSGVPALTLIANQDAIQSIFFVGPPLADEPPSLQEAPALPSVPCPLPIFGVAAAFGASRDLRKRIKARASKQLKESELSLSRP